MRLFELLVQGEARFHDPAGRLIVRHRVEARLKSELVHIVLEANDLKHFNDPVHYDLGIRRSQRVVVGPVLQGIERRISGPEHFPEQLLLFRIRTRVHGARHGLQPVKQI